MPTKQPTLYSFICPTCKEPMEHSETTETYASYISPLGHNHDDNCRVRVYTCKNGHKHSVSKRNRCPIEGCNWIGKEDCYCHSGKKVDEWPSSTTYCK